MMQHLKTAFRKIGGFFVFENRTFFYTDCTNLHGLKFKLFFWFTLALGFYDFTTNRYIKTSVYTFKLQSTKKYQNVKPF